MGNPLKPVLRLGSRVGTVLIGCASLTGLSAYADVVPTTGLRSLGTTVRENGSPASGCRGGFCQVEGGTSRGPNLFHRLKELDTRSGVTGVQFRNGNHRSVIVGVTSPIGSFITAPISPETPAGLFLLSPGGIRISGSGSFVGWQNLLLSTKTNLKIGPYLFNALTTVPDLSAGWQADPALEHASLSSDLASLEEAEITGNGPITVEGSLISVERNLLVDSGGGPITLTGATLTAGTTGTAGETSNGAASFKGATIRSTNSAITALRTGMEATDVTLDNTRVVAPRGLIRVSATSGITLVNDSLLDISPQKVEDLYGTGLGFVDEALGVVESRPGIINLTTYEPKGLGISINASTIQGSTNTGPLGAIDPSRTLRQDYYGGTIAVVSASSLDLRNAFIHSDSDNSFAGHIALLAGESSNADGIGLRISGSTLTADSLLGSGDVDLHARGGVEISGSTISANSWGVPQDPLFKGFQPAGEIRIGSESTAKGIQLEDTMVRAQVQLSENAPPRLQADELDPSDSATSLEPTSRIQLLTPGSIALNRSTLDTSSTAGFGGSIELQAGSAPGIQLKESLLLARTDATDMPAGLLGQYGRGGSIELSSKDGINVSKSSLDVSSTYSGLMVPAFDFDGDGINDTFVDFDGDGINDLPETPYSFPGTLKLYSEKSLTLIDSSLLAKAGGTLEDKNGTIQAASGAGMTINASRIDASGGTGGQVTLMSRGPGAISIAGSTLTNEADPAGSFPQPSIQVIGLDESVTVNAALSQFNPHSPLILFPSAANGTDELSRLAFTDATSRFDTLSSREAPDFGRIQVLAEKLSLNNKAPETDLIIDNRDPNRIILREVTTSLEVAAVSPSVRTESFDLTNSADLLRLRARLGEELLSRVVDEEVVSRARQLDALQLDSQHTTASAVGASQAISGLRDPKAQTIGDTLSGDSPGSSTTPPAPTTVAGVPALGLQARDAIDSLAEGEERSLLAVRKAMGLTGGSTKVPGIAELKASLMKAMLAIRQRQGLGQGLRLRAGAIGRERAPQLASRETAGTLVAVSRFEPDHYKPAILRYSFSTRSTAAGLQTDARQQQAGPGDRGFLDIVLVTADQAPQGWRVELSSAEFRQALASHYADMASMRPIQTSGGLMFSQAGRQLSEWLIEPVRKALEAQGITSLIITSDLSLIDVPFASLPLEGTYFGDRYSVSITPSLALTSLDYNGQSRRADDHSLLKAGASIFTNGLAPLPMVEQELSSIEANRRTTVLLNQSFTPVALLQALASPHVDRIHIASHAELTPGNQANARIYTSSSSIGLRELGQIRQRSGTEGLDLVSLSACRSAVSSHELELGFAGLAIQLGARSAIGTKWYVDDVATSSFFVQFYRHLDQGMPKAEALHLTQQAFLKGEVRVEGDKVIGTDGSVLVSGLTSSQQRRYASGFSHPYFWAGVNLVGSPW